MRQWRWESDGYTKLQVYVIRLCSAFPDLAIPPRAGFRGGPWAPIGALVPPGQKILWTRSSINITIILLLSLLSYIWEFFYFDPPKILSMGAHGEGWVGLQHRGPTILWYFNKIYILFLHKGPPQCIPPRGHHIPKSVPDSTAIIYYN